MNYPAWSNSGQPEQHGTTVTSVWSSCDVDYVITPNPPGFYLGLAFVGIAFLMLWVAHSKATDPAKESE